MLVAALALLGIARPLWTEAEDCTLRCASQTPGACALASGGKITPSSWGENAGDSLTWRVVLDHDLSAPGVAVRYAFGERRFGHKGARRLEMRVDGSPVGQLAVPDTGSWVQFDVATAPLPPLRAGTHRIELRSEAAESNTDVDCLALVDRGVPPGGPFVPSLRATSSDGRFLLRGSPGARVSDPQALFRGFARIVALMRDFGGWTPELPEEINVVEPGLWPDARWAAFSNQDGCFLRADKLDGDQGNWCHESTHLMFQGRIPRWMDEALVHTLTNLVWMPRLFAGQAERKDLLNLMPRASEALRRDPGKRVDSLTTVLYAIADRHGPDVFGRFLKACARQNPHPEHPLDTSVAVRLLSEAAGEDVTPMLARWSGWDAVAK